MKKKVSVIIGTRPEAVKLAPLVLALRERDDVILSVCKTGQHADMVDSVLDIFGIEVDVDFCVMGKTQNLNQTSAFLLEKFQDYYSEFNPDIVFVQGDTVSVLTGALAAFNQGIDIAHVEAGLRTGNLASPWPEEGFRRMVSPITRYHFAPTVKSAENLVQYGVEQSNIYITGNTVIDALHIAEKAIDDGAVTLHLPESITGSSNNKSVLITGHRRENFGSGLDSLCCAVARLAEKYTDIDFIFPVHLNPTVQTQVTTFFDKNNHSNVILVPPQPYLEFVWLMKNSTLIITDSGGIQEEAPSLGKPVLVTRDTTERPEGVEAGCVKLIGTSEESLFESVCELLDNHDEYQQMSQIKNPYGDGSAAAKIIEVLFKTV
jgi:UDP-N-acetylglucosamine 2-epimerase (non-hydrolysing)